MARAAVKRGLRLSVGSWNTIWMRLRSGSLANCLAGISPMFSPSNMIVPSVLSISRMTMVEVVDLPQPNSPTRPTLSPRLTWKLMPSTARNTSGSGAGPRRNSLLECAAEAFEALARILLHQLVDHEQRLAVGDVEFGDGCADRCVASSGSRSRSDTPGRGVARISLRV